MFGHPKGLKTLFFTEMWERLSYYGMRAILVLFLVDAVETGGFGIGIEEAGAIYGLYTAFVYLICLPGGWIADRILGLRRTVLLGGCIIAAGHFSMAIPTVASFYFGLVLIVIGTGLLKPNISAMVGDLYPEGGARRDAGFSIYYMGINLGALIGPLICGWLGEEVNWHLGFGAAGIGMVFGVIQYHLGSASLGNAGLRDIDPVKSKKALKQLLIGAGTVGGLLLILIAARQSGFLEIAITTVAEGTGVVIVGIAAVYFAYLLLFCDFNKEEKKRIGVIIVLFFSSAIFWSGFEQAGSSLNLFAEEKTDLVIFGSERPASWLQSINPLFIVILAPIFGSLWVWLGTRQPSIPIKFAMGLLLLSVGFLVLAWGSTYTADGSSVSPAWLVVAYFFHTSGELCVSPVGLSSVTKLAPKKLVGQMMGIWFTGTALGNLMAGLFGGMFEKLPLWDLFGAVACLVGGAGIIMLIAAKPVNRLTGKL